MNARFKKTVTFLGCDVSKDTVTFFDMQSGQLATLANDRKSLAGFLTGFDQTCFAVCEATGGYEACLLTCLIEQGIPAHRADAAKVKAFIRSFGTLGKTDAIDAKALALYGQERQPRLDLYVIPSKNQAELAALVHRRLDLVAMRTAEKNRAQAPAQTPAQTPGARLVATSIRQTIRHLEKQISAIESRIKDLIENNQEDRQITELMQQIKGVGAITAVTLHALMPELGSLTRRQAAALAGLAPHPDQSGKSDNYRRIKGGRKQLRTVLYMAALSAARTDPKLSPFYKRLREAGKKPIVAITAVMRKIIVIINARIRDHKIQMQS